MMPAKRAPRETARDRILETADRLFYTQGYGATGINQIIAEAQVAKASFYANYPSKEDLAIAYLERRHERWFAELSAQVDRRRTAVTRVMATFSFLEAWLPRVDFRGCAFLNLLGEAPPSGALLRVVMSHKQQLREFFRTSVAGIAPNQRVADRLGDQLVVVFEGAIIEAQVHKSIWPITSAAQLAATLLRAAGDRTS